MTRFPGKSAVARLLRAAADQKPRSPRRGRDGAPCHFEPGCIIMTQRGLWMMVMMEEPAVGRWHRELEAAAAAAAGAAKWINRREGRREGEEGGGRSHQ